VRYHEGAWRLALEGDGNGEVAMDGALLLGGGEARHAEVASEPGEVLVLSCPTVK